jgi:hypothetical protein
LARWNTEAVDGCAAEESELFIGSEMPDEVGDATFDR